MTDKNDPDKIREQVKQKFMNQLPMVNIQLNNGPHGDKPTLRIEVTGGNYKELFDMSIELSAMINDYINRELEVINITNSV